MKEEVKKSLEELFENSRVEKVDAVNELKSSFISYAMAVNVSRAIPDVRDGLKPVHRRIIYSMGDMGNTHDKPYRKCAKAVGEVMGNYHPHGDSSIYDALVRLAQDFSIRYPLIDGHGNFGSVDGDPPAAMRYTEARLSKMASLMLQDIDKETVDFVPNFDESTTEPSVLPTKFPNLLVNGADGIAVGMATNIPPHNLTEVISGVQAVIDDPNIEIDELIKIIPAPDYPTGGIIMGRTAIKNAYRTGRGGVVVRGRAEIEEMKGGRYRIVITELPYQVNKARFIIQVADQVKDKKLEGISDIKEESDRDGMRVIIEVKREANAQVVLNALYKQTMLQQSGGIIFLALVGKEPKILNLKEMLTYYLEHQKDVLVRKTRFELAKAKDREHIVKGLVIAQAHINEVIKTIRSSEDRDNAKDNLMKNFELSEKQAVAILEMKLARLAKLEVNKLKEELKELEILIEEYHSILRTPSKVMSIIRADLEAVKQQYGDGRKTEISQDLGSIEDADLIERQDVVVSLTHTGYIKRMPVTEYKAQRRGGVGITAHKPKEEDFVEKMFITNTHNDLLFFTNLGKVYNMKAYQIPEAQRQAKGRAIINLIQLEDKEKISAIIPIEEGAKGNLIMATKRGLIKKTKLSEFAKIKRVGKIAIRLLGNDELIGVELTDGKREIIIGSRSGQCIRFSEKDVRLAGRDTQGVKSMKLKGHDFIVDMTIAGEDTQILTVTEKGYGKRSPVTDYRKQARAGSGVKAGVFNDKTGKLIALKQLDDDVDVMLIADNGVIIRTPVRDISRFSRVSQGVRIMKLKGDTQIVGVALAKKGEEITDEEV